MKPTPHAQRGSALLTAVILTSVMLMLVTALLTYVGQTRIRAINESRSVNRQDCAQAGLQIARAYFAQNVSAWNTTYLPNPSIYDPVPASWMATLAVPQVPADPTSPTLQANHPELFADLDGDGKPDVYVYIRDNQDELPPAVNNWIRDNDQNVIVGAVCISSSMVPKMQNGQVDSSQLTIEGLLSYNTPSNGYRAQGGAGASGNGNLN